MKIPHPIPYQGSKRKLAPIIDRYLPKEINTFYEPFARSAAMTIYAAHYLRASRFVIADSLEPMIVLLRAIVEAPEETALKYRDLWSGQRVGDHGYFNRVRDRYNETRNHVDLLYLNLPLCEECGSLQQIRSLYAIRRQTPSRDAARQDA